MAGSGRHVLTAFAVLAALTGVPAPSASAAPECRCRYFGKYFLLGDTVCFRTDKGMRVAMCTLNQNVTSWEVTERACAPVSRQAPPAAPDRRERTNLRPARFPD